MRVDLVEKLAVSNVAANTIGSLIRKAYKHYSRTYHAPLFVVEREVSEYEALLVMFEDYFASMDAVALHDEIQKIYRKPTMEQLNSGNMSGSAPASMIGDEEWVSKMNIRLRQQEEEKRQAADLKKATELVSEVDKVIQKFNKSMNTEEK